MELRPDGETTEVSYMVAPEVRGSGLAGGALNAFLGWASSTVQLRRAILICDAENTASQRVAEKCGFDFIRQDGDDRRYERSLNHHS